WSPRRRTPDGSPGPDGDAGESVLRKAVKGRLHRVRDVNIATRDDRHVVGFAKLSKRLAGLTHRTESLAVGVELQNLAREAGREIHLLTGVEEETARQTGERPGFDELAVHVEDLHASVLAIGDINHALRVDDDRMREIELAGLLAESAP